jgi:hypothetical protein
MSLPIRQLPRGEYRFKDGTVLPIRGLSRAEALQLQGLGSNVTRLEILCIKAATDVTEEAAEEWHKTTPNEEVAELVDEIAKLSGFDVDTGKDAAGGLHSANLTELITSLQRISDLLSAKSESLQAPK